MVAYNIGQILNEISQKSVRKDLPALNIGDTVKMKVKVQEGDKLRLHSFEGTVIKQSGNSTNGTFTVRKVSFGEGVERTFPVHSPSIESIKVISRGVIKRAKLYYLRERTGKRSSVQREQVVAETTAAPAPAVNT